MPRELRTELQTLIATGHCNWHTTVDITLTGNQQLFLSSGEIYVNRFGKIQQYLAKLPKDGIEPLALSQDTEVDMMPFKVGNVDMVMGRTLTGAQRRMDGAKGIVGTIFIDKTDPNFAAGQHIWDAKMPGELVSGEVKDETVDFSLVSAVDTVIVLGRTIASEFQWREPVSNVPTRNPDDIPRFPVFEDGPPLFGPGRGGRYREFDSPGVI